MLCTKDGPNLSKGFQQFELGKLIEDGGCFYWKSDLRNTSTTCRAQKVKCGEHARLPWVSTLGASDQKI
jgi:hypothetical protein